MKNKIPSALIVVFALIVLFGCTMPGNDNLPDSDDEDTSIPETTKVLEESDLIQISSIDTDSITFSKPMDLQPGDVIVGGISTKTPNGILRKVQTVSYSGQQVTTSPANLEDAIQSCNVQFSNELTSSSVRSSSLIRGATRSVTPDGFDFGVNINDVVLFDLDDNYSTTTDQIVANGFLQFNITFGFNLRIRDFRIEDLSFQGRVEEELDIQITGEIRVATTKRIPITEYLFSPFVAAVIPSVPPIPIVIIPKITVYLDLDGSVSAQLSTNIQQGANLTSGLNYNGYSWSPIMEFSKYFQNSPPAFSAAASARVSVGSILTLALYGVAGPYLDTSVYLQVDASTNPNTLYWQITGGIDVGCGISVAVLGRSLVDHNTTLLGYVQTLASGEQALTENPPDPTGDRFIDMGNGTVKDNSTGLIWTKNANIYGVETWGSANTLPNSLSSGTHGLTDGSSRGDWRLPSIDELEGLVCSEYENPSLCNTTGNNQWQEGDPFTNVYYGNSWPYWSSSSYDQEFAKTVWFSDGRLSLGLKESIGGAVVGYVWPVRNAMPQEQ